MRSEKLSLEFFAAVRPLLVSLRSTAALAPSHWASLNFPAQHKNNHKMNVLTVVWRKRWSIATSDDWKNLMIEKSDDRSNWWLKHLMIEKYHLMVGKIYLMIEKHRKKYLMIIPSDDWSIWWLISKSDDWRIWLLKHLTIEASDGWSIWWMKHLTIVTMTIEA